MARRLVLTRITNSGDTGSSPVVCCSVHLMYGGDGMRKRKKWLSFEDFNIRMDIWERELAHNNRLNKIGMMTDPTYVSKQMNHSLNYNLKEEIESWQVR